MWQSLLLQMIGPWVMRFAWIAAIGLMIAFKAFRFWPVFIPLVLLYVLMKLKRRRDPK